jgi:tetratricopeptide (TPR) repeat protein
MIIVLAPNIYEKLDTKRAAENLDSILWESPHHQVNYGNARRAMVWGVAIMNDAKLPDLSIRSFHRRLAAKPDDYSSWFNLGQIYFDNDYLDSATFFFAKAVEYKPKNHIYLARLAEAEFETGRLDNAAEHIQQAASLVPALYNVRYLAGLIFRKSGDSKKALEHLKEAARLNSKAVGPFSYIGLIFYEQQQYDSAYNYLNRSLAKHPMNKPLYPPLIRTNLALGKFSEAAHVLNIYRQISPESGDISELRSLVNNSARN